MRHWKIILSLVAIFIVGFVSGGVMTLAITKRVIARHTTTTNLGVTVAQHYARQLDLTPEQVEKLKPIFARAAADVRSPDRMTLTIRVGIEADNLRAAMDWAAASGRADDVMMGVMLSMRQLNEEVARELTPGQQAKFEKMKERNRKRLKGQFNATLPPAMRHPRNPQ